jgi:hypothetical protein
LRSCEEAAGDVDGGTGVSSSAECSVLCRGSGAEVEAGLISDSRLLVEVVFLAVDAFVWPVPLPVSGPKEVTTFRVLS